MRQEVCCKQSMKNNLMIQKEKLISIKLITNSSKSFTKNKVQIFLFQRKICIKLSKKVSMQVKCKGRYKRMQRERKRRLGWCSKLKKRRNLKGVRLHHRWLPKRRILKRGILISFWKTNRNIWKWKKQGKTREKKSWCRINNQ